jgi:cyanophycinase-like exopeptidase
MGVGLLLLHGGGEAMPGDEPTALEALRLTPAAPGAGTSGAAAIRVVILPLATARGDPHRTTAHVTAFLAGVAHAHALEIDLAEAPVIDRASADDPIACGRLAAADLIVIPGGDPDMLPTVLPGSGAWRAIVAARRRGAVIWGASAGAMALAEWCWTAGGGVAGLSMVPGVVVAPHVPDPSATAWLRRLDSRPSGLGILTLAERTAIVGPLGLDVSGADPASAGSTWRCVGAGVAAWIPADALTPAIRVTDGEVLHLPG